MGGMRLKWYIGEIMKKYINSLALASLAMLISCAHTNKNKPDQFLTQWESSGSPCLDGVIINMAAAGCHEISTNTFPMGGIVEVRCANPRLRNPEYPYLSNTFVVTEIIALLPDISIPICSDSEMTVGVIYTWDSKSENAPPPSFPPTKPVAPGNSQDQPEEK
tara:strand:+ start:533 stop:1021 length:489 start_codon:yes stop_codon:yes gene_type:complete